MRDSTIQETSDPLLKRHTITGPTTMRQINVESWPWRRNHNRIEAWKILLPSVKFVNLAKSLDLTSLYSSIPNNERQTIHCHEEHAATARLTSHIPRATGPRLTSLF